LWVCDIPCRIQPCPAYTCASARAPPSKPPFSCGEADFPLPPVVCACVCTQIVEAVVRDEDVRSAVSNLKVNTHALRLSINDAALFAPQDAELGAPDGSTVEAAGAVHPAQPPAAIMGSVNESMVLLEAVAMSGRLCLLLVDARGVTEVVRCMATAAHVRFVPVAAAAPSLATTAMAALSSARGGGGPLDPKLAGLATPTKKLRAAVGKVVESARKDAQPAVPLDEALVVRAARPSPHTSPPWARHVACTHTPRFHSLPPYLLPTHLPPPHYRCFPAGPGFFPTLSRGFSRVHGGVVSAALTRPFPQPLCMWGGWERGCLTREHVCHADGRVWCCAPSHAAAMTVCRTSCSPAPATSSATCCGRARVASLETPLPLPAACL
jgi:hypothetical protein